MSSRVSRGGKEVAGATYRCRGASMMIVDGSGAKSFGPESLYLQIGRLQAAYLDVK